MEITESLHRLQDAKDNDRLVIFVGAGVSANSGIPTWGALVERIAKEIGYLVKKRELSALEYLRIPEYFYNQRRDNSEYYSLIKETLQNDNALPNPIDELIFKLLPHHIITTNYDIISS